MGFRVSSFPTSCSSGTSIPPYQSPWRNSTVMAPSGRNLTQGESSARVRAAYIPPPRAFASSASSEALPPDRDIMDGLKATPLKTISIPQPAVGADDVEIKKCTFIGSYNWIKRDNPTILVPGSPPEWTSRALPYNVPPDTGLSFVDQNGYRMPKAVLLPLILAVNKCSEGDKKTAFDWPSVDIVSDRNGLRKLLRWISGADRDFRIDLQLAGEKTVLFNRWEKRTREPMSGRTFGFSFEKASTEPAPGCKDSTGHHRIVTYDLNGLKMVVRFEVDACLPPPATYPRRSVVSIDELTQTMNAVTLAPSLSLSQSEPRLTILEGGAEVSANAVIEMSTRSEISMKTKGFDWKESYPQLYLSQTMHHMLAIHQRGRFTRVERRKLAPDVSKDEQPRLRTLRKALDLIKDIVVAKGKEGRLSLVCVDGELKVYERSSAESCLPESAMKLFELSK